MARRFSFRHMTMNEEEKERYMDRETPLYRAYGVKRRSHPVRETLVHTFAMAVLLSIFLVLLAIVVTVTLSIVSFAGTVTKFVLYCTAVILILFRPVRLVGKRLAFTHRLKKDCRRFGFRLTHCCGFWKGLLSRRNDAVHFLVSTHSRLYAVQYLTFPKYHTRLAFTAPGEMTVTTRLIRSSFHVILGIKPKVRQKRYSFPKVGSAYTKEIVNAFLMNPVPHSVSAADRDGVMGATGTGATLRDGTMLFSGTGFLSTLERESREAKTRAASAQRNFH